MSFKIVIAKYKEDVGWVNKYFDKTDVIIYDKSGEVNDNVINIPNVGREAETWMRYIVDNYYSLPDYIVFLQGKPFDHYSGVKDITTLLKQNPKKTICLSDGIVKPVSATIKDKYNYTHKKIYNMMYEKSFFGNEFEYYSYGAQYLVYKECVIDKPIEFYNRIQDMLVRCGNPTREFHLDEYKNYYPEYEKHKLLDAWCLEPMLPYIFGNIKVVENRYTGQTIMKMEKV